MPSIADMKAIMELGALAVAAFSFIGLAIWGFVKLLPVLSGLTKAIEGLTAIVTPVAQNQQEARDVLIELNEKVATKDDLGGVHTRLDKQGENISKIMGKVGA